MCLRWLVRRLWENVAQTITPSSTVQVEFIASYEATIQAIWLNFFPKLNIVDSVSDPIKINVLIPQFCFIPKTTRDLVARNIWRSNIVVRDKIKKRHTAIEHINTHAMIVDPLRKGLTTKLFNCM